MNSLDWADTHWTLISNLSQTSLLHSMKLNVQNDHPHSFWLFQWRHNERDGVPSHRRLHCLLNCWFRRRSKKTSKLRVTGLRVRGIHRWPVNSPHKRPVTRKMFPFDDCDLLHCNLHHTTKLKEDTRNPQWIIVVSSSSLWLISDFYRITTKNAKNGHRK